MMEEVAYWSVATCFWLLAAVLAWRVLQLLHWLFFGD